jgi:hypothetical protein
VKSWRLVGTPSLSCHNYCSRRNFVLCPREGRGHLAASTRFFMQHNWPRMIQDVEVLDFQDVVVSLLFFIAAPRQRWRSPYRNHFVDQRDHEMLKWINPRIPKVYRAFPLLNPLPDYLMFTLWTMSWGVGVLLQCSLTIDTMLTSRVSIILHAAFRMKF